MRDYNVKQNQQLGGLIELIRSRTLSSLDRKKVTVICQTDAHKRDVVFLLNLNNEETYECFEWQSQLRFSWRSSERDCFINILRTSSLFSDHFRFVSLTFKSSVKSC